MDNNHPINPNPGGQLDPDEILGRDAFIASLWTILSGGNIYMNDLRRIGKTMILNKMKAEPHDGFSISKRDFEGLRSAEEFAAQVYRDAHALLGLKKRTLRTMGKLLGAVSGAELAGVLKLPNGEAAPWKDVLTRTFADIHEGNADSEERVVFLWDEIPYLIDNIRQDQGAKRAMELLDTIRSLSQDYPSIRLLLTGSVGIHHVLARLREEGYNNSPLNTFERVSPGPLDHDHAVSLARRLIAGAKLETESVDAAAEAVATLTGDVPFYIHRLISRLPENEPATPRALEGRLVKELITPNNDWDLDHYRTRIGIYYPNGNDELVVLALLDSIAVAGAPVAIKQLFNEVKSTVEGADAEQIRALLKLLSADHYLTRAENGHYAFRLEIIRRWWALDRDL